LASIVQEGVCMWDVIVVGGGPAGLSAALVLARCARSVLVFDDGQPRNAVSRAVHGYLTQDGVDPATFLRRARREVQRYPSVRLRCERVDHARTRDGGFEVCARHAWHAARKLLLATGVRDELPPLPGIETLFGRSAFPCPYCDGWEQRGRPVAVYGAGERGLKLALSLTAWTRDLVLFSDGPLGLEEAERQRLARNQIELCETPVAELEGKAGRLEAVRLADGRRIPREALFFNTPSLLRSRLLDELGCPWSEEQGVFTDDYEATGVPGLFAAGNLLRDVQLVSVAAAEGARAAFGINLALTQESLR
jgi:thioredoxin reductase